MKRNFLIAMSAATLIFASCAETKTEAPVVVVPSTPLTGEVKLTVDAAASKISWGGEMLGLYKHDGLISLKEGSVSLKDGKVTGGNFTLDMSSIKPTDANYTAEKGHTANDLIGHLSSPDFFDVATNPTATFTITSVAGNMASGNLTLRGKTNPETVDISAITLEGDNVKITGKTTFNRQNYGVAFSMGMKDKVISDDITLNVELVGKI